ncbi:MAG TPA: hypothetical protein VF791_15430 [Pyrinomonadaceae bacterium]
MKRKTVLVSVVVLTSAIGVSVVLYAAIINLRTSSAPTQNSQERVNSSTKEAPSTGLSPREVSETSEKKISADVAASQQIVQPSANASPMPSQTISAAPSTTDKFSGIWVLDPARSEGLSSGRNQVMTVTQTENVIQVKTELTNERGEQTVTDGYTLNGQETDFFAQASSGGILKGRRVARWTTDRMGIEVNERSIIDTPSGLIPLETARRWTISADGKSLTIEMTVKGPRGTQQNKRLFVRK